MPGPRAIAAIANREGRDSQELLAAAVRDWRAAGVRVAGLLAENRHTAGECSAAFLHDIATGRRFSIELDAAPGGSICHLDPAGLDAACAQLLPGIAGADLVVLSKFGKTEAAGAGLRPAFAAVIAAGTPLLTTVSDKHAEAWAAFAPDALRLEPDADAVRDWWRARRQAVRVRAGAASQWRSRLM